MKSRIVTWTVAACIGVLGAVAATMIGGAMPDQSMASTANYIVGTLVGASLIVWFEARS